MSDNSTPAYGQGDATFQAAGGVEGVRALVDRFYDIMSTDPRFATIWSWHPADPELSRDKLARFLCAWMGGPRRFSEKYGPISIPKAHQHLPVTVAEHDQWLSCMSLALAEQNYPQSLVDYLAEQLAIPAGRVLQLAQRLEQS